MNKIITYSNYFKFRARIVVIPSSDNIMGSDIYPKYHKRATEPLEVMEFSTKVASIDEGFRKDTMSGLWLRNRKIGTDITTEDVVGQFESISIAPPYWYHDEHTFLEFWQLAIEAQASLEAEYTATPGNQTRVEAGVDEYIPVVHYYKDVVDWTTRAFHKNKVVKWPKQKGIKIVNKSILDSQTILTEEDTSTSEETSGGASGGY